jgi:hypothetical protein
MKKKIFGGIAILAIAVVAALNVNVSSKADSSQGDILITLKTIDAIAHTIGCESTSGTVLYYCIDYSVVTVCTCANTHNKHIRSNCPDRYCP